MTGNYPREWRDVTAILLAVLNEQRGGTNLPAVPRERPTEFVLVRRSGGRLSRGLDYAQMDIEVWKGEPGGSLEPANAEALEVAEILRLAPFTAEGSGLSSVTIDTIGYLADELSGAPRVLISVTAIAKPATGA